METSMTKLLRLTWTGLFSVLISGAGILFADCPEGSRPTTELEQQHYVANMEALKAAVPNAPEGWELQPGKFFPGAPSSVCKGSKPVAAFDAAYVSLAQRKQNEERGREYEARIANLRKLSPEEQKEADSLYHQGSELGYKSIAELKNKNQAESDRLRAEANKAYAASRAVQTAHLEKVLPQIRALQEEQQAGFVNPEVKVHIIVRDLAADQRSVKSEPTHFEGIAKAYYAADKTLAISLGVSPDGQPVWVQLQGDRKQVETVARQFANATNKAALASR
jgi:hypothetical protein